MISATRLQIHRAHAGNKQIEEAGSATRLQQRQAVSRVRAAASAVSTVAARHGNLRLSPRFYNK
jgi:hypothetical protein